MMMTAKGQAMLQGCKQSISALQAKLETLQADFILMLHAI